MPVAPRSKKREMNSIFISILHFSLLPERPNSNVIMIFRSAAGWRANGSARIAIVGLFLIVVPLFSNPASRNDAYGSVPPADYLTGKFHPEKHALFVSIGDYGIPVRGRTHYLRKEVAIALKAMLGAFRKAHPDIPVWVRSSTRNFYDQKAIWENKWNGRTLVEGKKLNRTIPNFRQRALKILEYSSMPGTSRHHWGTDFDLNELTNRYYESGKGAVLFRWLEANAKRFGFCRPYTAGRTSGYEEEKWHWSYIATASVLQREWLDRFASASDGIGGFAGAKEAKELAPVYVSAVSAKCTVER